MTREEAIQKLVKYAESDYADASFQDAVQLLKQEKNYINYDSITTDNNFPKPYTVAVQKIETIHYEVLHDSLDDALEQVQKKVNERDWKHLLEFPPGSPDYKPIPPFTGYKIKDVTLKEIVLRPNPHSEGGSSDT
jgi:hypothetical protein|tara:strand:+ start:247 stop:651 length:405 start_codon:yes stop_codon:yes gene_type:complete